MDLVEFLSRSSTSWTFAAVTTLFGIYQWIKRERKSIDFEIHPEGVGQKVSRDGINYPWETITFQLQLVRSDSQLQGVNAVLFPGRSRCKIPVIWTLGNNHTVEIRSKDIPLIENSEFDLVLTFRDLDGDYYTYTLPTKLVHEGTNLILEKNGVGRRKRLFIRNIFNL